jgi:hypothetical protein
MAAMAIVLYHHVLLLMLDSGYLLGLFRRQGNDSTDCGGNDDNKESRRRPTGYSLRGAVVFERQDQKDPEHSTTMMVEMIHEEEDETLLQVLPTAPSFPLRGGRNGDDKINYNEDRAKFLFAPSIYGMAFPEELEGTSSGYDEDGTRVGNVGNEGNVLIPTPSSKVSSIPSPSPNTS